MERYPVKTRKLKRTSESIWLLWIRTSEALVWLNKRPVPGVWAGLYCFPLFSDRAALEAVVPASFRHTLQDLPVVRHVLTHKDLFLHPVCLRAPDHSMAGSEGAWFAEDRWPVLGLPAPVRKLLAHGWQE